MSVAATKSVEPTMEEILASIRRIIADDQASPATSAATARTDAGERSRLPDREALHPIEHEAPRPIERPALAALAPSAPAAVVHAPLLPPHRPRLVEIGEAIRAPLPSAVAATPAYIAPRPAPPPIIPSPVAPVIAAPPVAEIAPPPTSVETLISEQVEEAVASSFGALAHSQLAQNLPPLEDIIREMLRPMLSTWLDDNLPTIVERLVRAEIERVARGGRG